MVRSPLGLPLGDRGLVPLPDVLPGFGAGSVAGGPYTLPQRMLDTLTGASSRTGAQGGSNILFIVNPRRSVAVPVTSPIYTHVFLPKSRLVKSAQGQRGLELSTSGARRPFRGVVGSPPLSALSL